MQGLMMAHAGKAAAATGVAGAGNAAPGDVMEEAGESAFGAILAGQIKGQAQAEKSSVDAALPELTDLGKGKIDGLATDDATASDVLGDLLALVNAGVVPVQITPAPVAPASNVLPGGAADFRGANQLALAMEGAIAGQMTAISRAVEVTGKLADVNDAGAGANTFAGLMAGKAMVTAGNPAVEGFAAFGKKLPVAEPLSQNAALPISGQIASLPANKTADAGSAVMEKFAGGGNMLPTPTVEPSLGKAALDAFAQTKPAPAAPQQMDVAGANDLSALLALPQPTAMVGGQASTSPASTLEIAEPVGSPAWGNALAEKVTWMSGQGNQVAELHLNPPHLGPLEVQLTVTNDQASAVFVSHQPAVREAIEAAMPRLREMLADSGIMLGNTMVGAESFQQQQQQASAKNSGGGSNAGETGDDGANIAVPTNVGGVATNVGIGMVDTFA